MGEPDWGSKMGAVEVGSLEEKDQEHLERDWMEHLHEASEPAMERAGWGREHQS